MNTTTPSKLLTNIEAAEFLGVKPQTLEAWRCTGKVEIPFTRVGRCIRYRLSDLEHYLDQQTATVNA